MHSNVWCIGKNDNNTSVGYSFTQHAMLLMFAHIFACDSITAFGSFVVPEVNNIIDILFSSISMLSYFWSPFFIWFLPSSSISLNVFIPFSCMLSIHISVFRLLFSFSCTFFIVSKYFSSKIIAFASLLSISLCISMSGSALSIGTITMLLHVVAK